MLGITMYVLAILTIMLPRENDPCSRASAATPEDWTDAMQINMYGCDKYGCDADGTGKLFGFKAAASSSASSSSAPTSCSTRSSAC